MKKITNYKLQITSVIPKPLTVLHSYALTVLRSYGLTVFCFSALLLFCFFPATAQVTNVQTDFSCPGVITVKYYLNKCTDVTLYYSDTCDDWSNPLRAQPVPKSNFDITPAVGGVHENGNTLTGQTAGSYTITWNSGTPGFGKVYVRVMSPASDRPPVPEWIEIGGTRFATRNLDVNGQFVANPEDLGALYQWGRVADGHESRTSPCWPTASACGTPENSPATSGMLTGDQVTCPGAPCGYFIRVNSTPYDWRPQNNALWNSGNETTPVKTTNDPCPDGWRVPTETELAKLVTAFGGTPSTLQQYDCINGLYIDGTDPSGSEASLFLPASGLRSFASANITNVGTGGYYHSSNTSGFYSRFLIFLANSFDMANNQRTRGTSVRCVVDQ